MRREKNDFIDSLYRTEYHKLFRVAYRIVGNEQTAEDLVHDTFCLASFQWQKLSDHPNPGAWLMNALKKLASNELRRAENRLTVPLEETLSVSSQETGQNIEELLPVGLSVEYRQVLIWRFKAQMGYPEMARQLGLSEAGCRTRVARAVAKCRQLMKNDNL